MKKWKKIVISLVLVVVLVCATGVGGYTGYVNRKVNSADVSNLQAYENLALLATVTDADNQKSTKITDGKWRTGVTVQQGDSITFAFETPITANTVLLKETLDKTGSLAYALEGGTKQFSIYASLDGEEKLIYRNDKIDSYRMCTFPDTTFDTLRIQFDDCRDSAKINEAEIYNVGKTSRDTFRINDYFVYEGEDYQHNEQFISYLDSVTDLTLFIGVWLDENGAVDYNGGKEAFAERLADVRAAIGDRDIKLYCNVFSNDTDASFFADNSKIIAKNLADFVTEFSLDGVDLDWEYPSGKKDWAAYNQLALDLHSELSKIGKKFSLATAVWNMRFSDEAKEAVDYFNIMIYDHVSDDYNGYHSTFKQTTLAIERLYYQGYDMQKICLGIPYYGRNLKNSACGNFWVNYCNSGISDRWTNTASGNFAEGYGVQPAYLNSYAMVRDKTAYAISMSLGGIMTWHMMTDMPTDSELCLHNAVQEACQQRIELPNAENEQ
ncbi:MAG: glycoside hydrolase family 18 protein [Candidatus Fimenecus sp.]